MATFDEFYSSLDSDPRIRGKQFEKFVKWFLKNDPVWASQVKDIWLWDEHPKRSEWGPDCGIDLVFEDFQNKTWAVQAKCFAPESSIKKEDMDSFISESSDSRFQGRLLVASTDRIGNNADRLLKRHEVVKYLLNDFRSAQINFPNNPNDLSKGNRKDLRKPRPHQLDAIDAVKEGLKTTDRGQVLMACGTGKTLTSLWIKERLGAEEVLVLLPSLSLLSQTLKEWNAAASIPFKWICVCSDKSVAKIDKTEDDWITNTSEVGVPVTSDIKEINNFINEKGYKVIFSTYQSSHLVSQAQIENLSHTFDVVFADEAHRCAGKVSDAFGCILDAEKIRAKKRLFFTATPRVLSNRIKGKAKANDIEIASMDDHSVFGKILYQLKFSEAIKRNLLSDYQVIIIGIDNFRVREQIKNRDLIAINGEKIFDAETLASKIALTKALKNYKLKRVITFHGRIKHAKKFAHDIEKVIEIIHKKDLPEGIIKTDFIAGSMKSSERNEKIQSLKNLKDNEIRILTNARCLSEGVDVPTLDGIGFIDPKSSQVDIIQAVGRAIRKSENKKRGTILIPVYLGNLDDTKKEILASRFKDVWQVILALKSQDDYLMERIDKFRISLGKRNISIEHNEFIEKIKFDMPDKIQSIFSESIQTILVRETSDNWYERYGALKEYINLNNKMPSSKDSSLGSWINTQRQEYKKKILVKERIKLLEDINFIWDPFEETWFEKYKVIKEYYRKNGHANIPNKDTVLSDWIALQRKYYKNNKLSQKYIQLLEDINFCWDPLEESWQAKYQELKEFAEKYGHTNPSDNFQQLNLWVTNQRTNYRKNQLSKERIELLEDLNFIWDFLEESWQAKYQELKEFAEKYGHTNLNANQSSLGRWVSQQRNKYTKNKLSKERIILLEKIKLTWDADDERWQAKYQELKEFAKKHGHANPIDKYPSIGNWVSLQRRKYKKNKLSAKYIQLLEDINICWDPAEEIWQKNYKELKKFAKKYGHTNVPNRDPLLGEWVGNQRKEYKKGKLTKERIQLLEEINFIWDFLQFSWNEKYQELKEFNNKNINLDNSMPSTSHLTLGSWINTQRQAYKKNSLSKEKIQLLESLKDWSWRKN